MNTISHELDAMVYSVVSTSVVVSCVLYADASKVLLKLLCNSKFMFCLHLMVNMKLALHNYV